ncbi:gliding motility lipoprotein GldH [Parapedobacter defluvii]|uniref:Gliding motility lipoprotein GldH n=1 Tax=Parapedobacter defluvii TaxID=2045106 RepID=A0ABQ1M363_9SPHI|nr:gliding motility lipoprotein GldH [Parapedobacter defluvii]RQP07594.1 MAG: gliding motility lipoprotein GldH [Parapedobacter sp.]GGC30792.1 gliding motility lipoprotein GldH [Parapedobacter defluvii]
MGIKWTTLLGIFLMTSGALSCTDTAVLDQNVAITDRAWRYEDQPQLTAHITDITRPYNIYLNLRHTPGYKYSNVFILLHQRLPNGRDTTERFELELAEPDGRWLGRSTGSVYTHQQLIKEAIRLPDTGNYVFTLEQNMRENPLLEITDVGIRIEPAE